MFVQELFDSDPTLVLYLLRRLESVASCQFRTAVSLDETAKVSRLL